MVENMRNLKRADVIQELKEMAKFAKENKCMGVDIYYTGHGEKFTGNWVFSDGVITLNQVMKALKVCPRPIYITLDCCFAGNWTLKLHRYKNSTKMINIRAASFPGKVAYDTAKGGLFTSFICKGWTGDLPVECRKINWCEGKIGSVGGYHVQYFKARQEMFQEDSDSDSD